VWQLYAGALFPVERECIFSPSASLQAAQDSLAAGEQCLVKDAEVSSVMLRRETRLVAEMLYHGLTTGAGVQTLGEEYCDILQVAGKPCRAAAQWSYRKTWQCQLHVQ